MYNQLSRCPCNNPDRYPCMYLRKHLSNPLYTTLCMLRNKLHLHSLPNMYLYTRLNMNLYNCLNMCLYTHLYSHYHNLERMIAYIHLHNLQNTHLYSCLHTH